MVLRTIFQHIFYKLFLAIMTIVFSVNPYVGPSTETPITVSNPDEVKATIAVIADTQVSNYMFGRYPTFKAAAEDLQNSEAKFDALIGVGDIAENGLSVEYQLIYDGIGGLDTRYIMAVGNHDIRLRLYEQSRNTFSHFVNTLNGDDSYDSFSYTERVNGYKVIVLGSDKTKFEESYLSDAQLEWLDSELKAEEGKPVFVVLHQPLKNTHNIEEAWNSPFEGAGSVGDQSIALKAIMSKYQNVFLITGHLHSGFGPHTYNNVDGIHSINLPSFSVKNATGTYNDPGTGYILEIYEDELIFRARDFAKGVWVAEATGDSSYDLVIPFVK